MVTAESTVGKVKQWHRVYGVTSGCFRGKLRKLKINGTKNNESAQEKIENYEIYSDGRHSTYHVICAISVKNERVKWNEVLETK